MNDVLQILSNTTKSIATVNAQPTKDMKFANIHVSFEIANLIELTGLVDKIKIILMFTVLNVRMVKELLR